ncbi:hypothetical protein AGABI1DRAFT_134826, partial [Agaricus bisporus var. burnettii JB137-S8]
MSHISGYGGALHMSMYNEISAILSNLTTRITKRTVISERADFDERYFPGTSKAQLEAVPSFACLPESLPLPNDTCSYSGLPPLQDEGGDNHFPPARPKTPTPSASVPPEEKP